MTLHILIAVYISIFVAAYCFGYLRGSRVMAKAHRIILEQVSGELAEVQRQLDITKAHAVQAVDEISRLKLEEVTKDGNE